MSSQTENPPPWDTPGYWEWVQERYLADDPLEFGVILSNGAEYRGGYVRARQAGVQDGDAEEVAREYCLGIFQARPSYDPAQPIKPFFDTILAGAIQQVTSRNGHSKDSPPGLTP